jgi:hypothetical protein
MRPFVRRVVDLVMLPHLVLYDFYKVVALEKTTSTYKFEWCLSVPPDCPSHLPPVGSPALIVDRQNCIIKMVVRDKSPLSLGIWMFANLIFDYPQFRFSNPDPKKPESLIVPLCYNYVTGVIGRWYPEGDSNDLTVLPEGELLRQRLADLVQNKATPSLDKIFYKGQGKLFLVLKHLCGKIFLL